MKTPKRMIHLLIGFEVLLMAGVILAAILNPIGNRVQPYENKGQTQISSEDTSNTTEDENAESDVPVVNAEPMVFSQEIQDKVDSMTLEQKVAQMFVTTPEQLTDIRQVTATGNTSRDAISSIPVGGLVYSALNFEGTIQTASMTQALQEHCTTQLGTPLFMMVAEAGGADMSPLATNNGFEVQLSASEVGATGDVQQAVSRANNIAAYLTNQGLNTNIGLLGDMPAGVNAEYDANTFSADADVAAAMMEATVNAYHEAGVIAAMTMLPGESAGNSMDKDLAEWQSSDGLVYGAGISAGVDMIIVSNGTASAFTGDGQTPCCMSANMVNYIRGNMQYQGILMTDSLGEAHLTERYSVSDAAIQAINAGMDMVYCPAEFKTAYQAVLDAVRAGTISEETIDTAVMRILTCKSERF